MTHVYVHQQGKCERTVGERGEERKGGRQGGKVRGREREGGERGREGGRGKERRRGKRRRIERGGRGREGGNEEGGKRWKQGEPHAPYVHIHTSLGPMLTTSISSGSNCAI